MLYHQTNNSPRLWQPQKKLRARLTVDTELAVPVLRLRHNHMIMGERVNDLSPLPPERFFREKVLEGARLWVSRMVATRERYRLQTPESELTVWGPHQVYEAETDGAQSIAQDEWKNQDGLTFFLVGDFIAEYGFYVEPVTPEETTKLKIATVNEWKAAERAAEQMARRN